MDPALRPRHGNGHGLRLGDLTRRSTCSCLPAATSTTSPAAAARSSAVTYGSRPGQRARYRLYSDVTKEHLYTTDTNEYGVLTGRGWVPEGVAHWVLVDATPVGGVTPVPLYRLYHAGIRPAPWTTDANEYAVLATRGWAQEGTDGYVLPSAVAGVTVPLYRLAYAFLPIHLWTTDANEYAVLATRGWIQEGVAAHVLP